MKVPGREKKVFQNLLGEKRGKIMVEEETTREDSLEWSTGTRLIVTT